MCYCMINQKQVIEQKSIIFLVSSLYCYQVDMLQKIANIVKNQADKSITIMPTQPFFSVIWLHGLGDSAEGFLQFFKAKESPVSIGGRIKLLNAPRRRVTINGGMQSTSWYDIIDLSPYGKTEERFSVEEVKESLKIIEGHVQGEIEYWRKSGINGSDQQICRRIFIGGFSQGCAMSLCYALTSNRLLGGAIGYSGHLFEGFQFRNKDTLPMLVYHGDSDMVLNYQWVKPGYDKHLKPCKNFEFTLIEGLPHSVEIDQLIQTTAWIGHQLKRYDIKL